MAFFINLGTNSSVIDLEIPTSIDKLWKTEINQPFQEELFIFFSNFR